jgi:hypothetical protein
MATRRIFWGFCIIRFGIGPLLYISSRSDFDFEFAEIFVIEKRLPDSPIFIFDTDYKPKLTVYCSVWILGVHAMHRGYKYATKKEISIMHTAKSSSCLRVEAINMQQQKELKFPPSELCIKHYLCPIVAYIYFFPSMINSLLATHAHCTDNVD